MKDIPRREPLLRHPQDQLPTFRVRRTDALAMHRVEELLECTRWCENTQPETRVSGGVVTSMLMFRPL